MLIPVLVALGFIVLLFFIVVATRPSEFRVARATTIAVPPQTVFTQVNDFHNWTAWSPWEKLDPAMQRTFAGASAGVGAIYSWIGNKQVGEGRMTVTESRASDLIRIKLEFLKPFATTSVAEFTFEPSGQETVVTWSMTGRNNFISRAFCLFMNMDKMVGKDFEKGLTNLKALVEAAS